MIIFQQEQSYQLRDITCYTVCASVGLFWFFSSDHTIKKNTFKIKFSGATLLFVAGCLGMLLKEQNLLTDPVRETGRTGSCSAGTHTL